jgi:hypothetical protein
MTEEFYSDPIGSGTLNGNTLWSSNQTFPSWNSSDPYGVLDLTTTASSNNISNVYHLNRMAQLSDKTFDTLIRFKLSTTASNKAFFGYGDLSNDGEANNNFIAIGYSTSSSDTTYMCLTRSGGGTANRVSITGATADTNYHTARIRSTTPGTILCSIDGGTEVSTSTAVPTVATMRPQMSEQTLTGTAATLSVDYFFATITGITR